MYARFDFISPETGRVLLSTLFDASQDRLPAKRIAGMLNVLDGTQRKLEKLFGKGMVRLSLDGYEASVFWALVLFRPIILGGDRVSIYDIILRGDAEVLQRTNLGVVYEPEHKFITIDWNEAPTGILEDFDKCISWKKIVKAKDLAFWRHCAESHSWVVPAWILDKLNFLRGKIWFQPGLSYNDITVLDTRGIEVIRLESLKGESRGTLNEAQLLTAHNVKFIHHYTTSDKREFKLAHHKQKMVEKVSRVGKDIGRERVRAHRLRKKELRNEGIETKNRSWYMASRIVGSLPRLLGRGMLGKYPPLMSAADSNKRLGYCLLNYINGEISALTQAKWNRVEVALARLADLLQDLTVPREFGEWLIWKNRGINVEAYLAGRKK